MHRHNYFENCFTDAANSGNFFAGNLDDLKIYNRLLSADEAYQLHINPWQMFDEEKTFAYNTVAAGAATINRQYSFVAG